MFDLSHPLSACTPFIPGAPPVHVEVLERATDPAKPERRSLNVTRLAIMVHTGTHMDAPFHFFDNGMTIDQVPLEQCTGVARSIDVQHVPPRGAIRIEDVRVAEGTRKVILHTGWWRNWGSTGYFFDHPVISGDAAQYLMDAGVHLIGIDVPSVDQPPFPAHQVILGAGAVIVENLTRLDQIPEEIFYFSALPLSIAGRDGSPVRAIGERMRH
jgi:kynurenine formamidase